MNTLNKLIGAQLVDINNEQITIRKKDKIFTLNIINEEGDCCGFNDIATKCLFEPNSDINPIIVNVTIDNKEVGDGETCVLTFFGEDKEIAKLETYSSSGSGWAYGANVRLHCSILEIDEILSCW